MCTKTAFKKRQAEAMLRENQKSSKQYRKEVRAYYCPKHNAWHLTSQEYVPESPIEVENKKVWAKYMEE